ncbi:hypothetical protein MNBD_CHLOROFLEXI01-5326 [hydrothermal vent metagenome]|uniref:SnoaL-like domain-containing protein n=1 Tax=hydrothermal vent metagenome TaxID=652676 RepID=A0A3B0V2K6_9ZZZZ
MLTEKQAKTLANHWIESWNTHDLEQIMSHYDENIILISPVAATILNDPIGVIFGKTALRAYFKKGLEAYPELNFQLIDVLWGLNSVMLYYINQKGTKTAEFMEIGLTGKVSKVVANYNG